MLDKVEHSIENTLDSSLEKIEELYRHLTPGSAALSENAKEVFPSGITHDSRHQKPYGPYIARAEGSRKWDVDNNEYIDYVGGHGSHLLGHGNKAVIEAVQKTITSGTQVGGSTDLEVEHGQIVKEMVPCAERIRFTMSGTEATHLALRLARAYTGKSTIIRFTTHYHGWHDSVVVGYSSHFDGSAPRGISSQTAAETLLLPPGDIEAVTDVLTRRDDIAAILLEPTGSHFGLVPIQPEFVKQLRELTEKYGVVLIFDEVICGFRVAPGGAQQALGITPDMSTHAKIISGGLPGGAVCGKKAILDVLDFDVMAEREEEKVAHNGTFNANRVSAAAGIAMLRQIRDTDACERANQFAARLRNGMNQMFSDQGLGWAAYGTYSGFFIFTNPENLAIDPLNFDPCHYDAATLKLGRSGFPQKLVLALLTQGVHLAGFPGGWVSAVHSERDFEDTMTAFGNTVPLLKAESERASLTT